MRQKEAHAHSECQQQQIVDHLAFQLFGSALCAGAWYLYSFAIYAYRNERYVSKIYTNNAINVHAY